MRRVKILPNFQILKPDRSGPVAMPHAWQQKVAEALKGAPNPNKIYWFNELGRFPEWVKFVEYLVRQRNAISFSHKSSRSVAMRYDGQPVVIFTLPEASTREDAEHVLESIQKLKAGVLFCPKRGVQTFAQPHVLVFAEMPYPGAKRAAPAEPPAPREGAQAPRA